MGALFRTLFTTSVILALGACGGGGGASPSPTTFASSLAFPFAQAFANFVSNSHSLNYSMAGNDAGKPATGSGTIIFAAAAAATFEGQDVLSQTAIVSGTTTEDGQTTPYSATVQSFYTTNYEPLGSTSSTDYCVARTAGSGAQ